MKGKQHKLDVNHNGHLDAEDFKMLRSGKKGKKKHRKDEDKFIERVVGMLMDRVDEAPEGMPDKPHLQPKPAHEVGHGGLSPRQSGRPLTPVDPDEPGREERTKKFIAHLDKLRQEHLAKTQKPK